MRAAAERPGGQSEVGLQEKDCGQGLRVSGDGLIWNDSLCAYLRCSLLHRFVAREPSVAQFENALAVARVFFGVRDLHDGRAWRC